MPTPVVAPYVATYANRVPYITVDEFLNAPTGVDSSQVKPGASPADNRAVLAQLILRASSEADLIARQVLAASVDTQAGRYRVTADGTIKVPVDNTPLVAVTDVKVGTSAGNLTALTDLSGCWLSRKAVEVPIVSASFSPFTTSPSAFSGSGKVFAQVTYVNGFANTTLGSPAIVGATSITPDDVTGIFPGQQLTIYDFTPANWETVTVSPSYVYGAATVPLTAPLAAAHNAGTAVSAFPGAIKQAVIHLVTFLIKSRGAEAVAVDSFGAEPGHTVSAEAGGIEEYDWAVDLLEPFRRVW